jgi:hypothetical protein
MLDDGKPDRSSYPVKAKLNMQNRAILRCPRISRSLAVFLSLVALLVVTGCGRTGMGLLVREADSAVGGSGGAGASAETGTGGSGALAAGADGPASGPCGEATCLDSLYRTCVPEGRCFASGGSSPSAVYGSACYANGITVSYQGTGTGAGVRSETTVRRNRVICYSIVGSSPPNSSAISYVVSGANGEEIATGAAVDKSGLVTVTCHGSSPAIVDGSCLHPPVDRGSCDLEACPLDD